MRRSKFYNMRLPERGAREGEANDAADIEDLTYDLGIIDAEMERQRLEDVRLEKDKATKLEMSQHKSAAVLDHPDGSVTDAKLGQRTVLTTSGPLQILLTAIGNAVKAISGASTWNGTPATTLKDAKTHMDDAVKHITAQEREGWNAAATDRHSHTNKSVLDGITAAMVTAWNTVSSKLPLAGGTLTGFLTLHAAPATDMHAATKKYVDDKMAASGSGDMTKAVYDPGGRELPYIPKQDVDALAWGGDFGASGAPVSIAYAGANRIASITAYGENAQGGTTEAPVALTGVDSVHVCGRNLLPMPYSQVSETKNGLNIAVNADGTITVSGTATAETYLNLNPIPASLYRLMGLTGIVPAQNYPVTKNGFTFFDMTIQPYGEFAKVYIVITKGSVVNRTYRPYIIKSAEPLPYETYQGSVTPIPIPRALHKVGDVRDVCVTRQEYEGTEKLVVTYNVGFVELDGTENWQASSQTSGMFFITRDNISAASAICSNFNFSAKATTEQGKFYIVSNQIRFLTSYETLESWKNYLAAQKAEGTPVQIAYQLATPEVYATDPLDIDNAAGPLTVMTGGELEVRMTELVGSRTYDADGDGVVDRANSVDGGTY